MNVTVKQVISKRDMRRFIGFPYRLYKDNPFWVPPLLLDEKMTLTRGKNAALDFCDLTCWLAYDENNNVVGRIAGIINNRFIEQWGAKHARFGWFDFIDDETVSAALLNTVEAWAVEKGMDAVNGPLGFTDFDKEGLLIEGFEELGTMATIYNYPYYERHLENHGYGKDVDWVEYNIVIPDEPMERLQRLSDIVLKKYGLNIYRGKSKKELAARYGRKMFALLNDAYGHLYGFVTLTEKQIDQYIQQYLGFLQMKYLCLILDDSDDVIGVGITMPSFSAALQKSRGRLFPLGFLNILKAFSRPRMIDLYLVAVKSEFQGKGVTAAIINNFLNTFSALGVKYAESNPELENNLNVQGQWKFFEHRQHKRRRCFVKKISAHGEGR